MSAHLLRDPRQTTRLTAISKENDYMAIDASINERTNITLKMRLDRNSGTNALGRLRIQLLCLPRGRTVLLVRRKGNSYAYLRADVNALLSIPAPVERAELLNKALSLLPTHPITVRINIFTAQSEIVIRTVRYNPSGGGIGAETVAGEPARLSGFLSIFDSATGVMFLKETLGLLDIEEEA